MRREQDWLSILFVAAAVLFVSCGCASKKTMRRYPAHDADLSSYPEWKRFIFSWEKFENRRSGKARPEQLVKELRNATVALKALIDQDAISAAEVALITRVVAAKTGTLIDSWFYQVQVEHDMEVSYSKNIEIDAKESIRSLAKDLPCLKALSHEDRCTRWTREEVIESVRKLLENLEHTLGPADGDDEISKIRRKAAQAIRPFVAGNEFE